MSPIPILFSIFINDLPASISSASILLFADDAKIFNPISNLDDTHYTVHSTHTTKQYKRNSKLVYEKQHVNKYEQMQNYEHHQIEKFNQKKLLLQ